MKLFIVTDQGEVIETIDALEQYDLSKPLARIDLCDMIQHALEIAETIKMQREENNKPHS